MSAAIKTLDKQNTSVQGMFDRVGAWVDDVLQRRKNIGTITELPLSSRAIQTVIDAALIDRRLTKKVYTYCTLYLLLVNAVIDDATDLV